MLRHISSQWTCDIWVTPAPSRAPLEQRVWAVHLGPAAWCRGAPDAGTQAKLGAPSLFFKGHGWTPDRKLRRKWMESGACPEGERCVSADTPHGNAFWPMPPQLPVGCFSHVLGQRCLLQSRSSRHLLGRLASPLAGRRRALAEQARPSVTAGVTSTGPAQAQRGPESLEAGALGARGSSRAGRVSRDSTAPWPGRCGRGGGGSVR